MNKILQFAFRKSKVVLLLLGILVSQNSMSQCAFGFNQYGSGSAPTTIGATNNVSTCSYLGEYGIVSGFLSTNVYTVSIGGSGYITVFNSSNTAVAWGASPLSFTPPANGTYNCQWNTATGCGSASGCLVSSVTLVGPSNACTNPAAGGSTVSTPAAACPGQSINLTLSGASTGTGLTYQWQSSSNGTTYANIAGATSQSYSTTQSATTYYQCIVTCASGTPATSTPVQVDMNTFLNCYCASSAIYAADEEIWNVTLGTLNNTSDCFTTGGPGSTLSLYSDYTNTTPALAIPTLVQGFSNPMSLGIGTCGTYNYNNMSKVWIDFNQNGSFSDPGEEIYASAASSSGAHTETFSFITPATAALGTTRMRVTVQETTAASNITPCNTTSNYYGEVEDYFVNIVPPLAIDAGISAFVNPVIPTCNFSDSVAVVINNFGTDTLETCTINWSWNGFTQTPFFWTGSLPQFGVDTVSIGLVAFGNGDSFSAWTSLPNLTVENSAGAYNDQTDLVGLVTGLTGTYTIGGALPDFPDMATALSVLDFAGVCGPVVFDIRTGTYYEQFELNAANGMDATNTVTFRAETGNRDDVVFDYSPTTLANNYVARLNGADYYILEHMTLRNSAATYGRVVDVLGGSDYNMFHDLVLNTVTSSSTSNYMAVIYSGSGTADNYNTFDGCQILGGGYGAYWYGGGTSNLEQGTVFTNNEFENNYYMGLYSYYQSGATYSHNHVFGNSTYTSRYGMYLSYNQNGLQSTYNTIEGNATSYFYIGMYIYYSDATPTNNGLIANNSIAAGLSTNTTSTYYGLYHYYSGYNNVYNNSINLLGGGSSARAAYFYSGGANNVKNNNFVTTGLGYAMYLYGAYTISSSDNNNYKTNGANPFYFNTNISTLAAWQAALSQDANSIMVDPGYYSDFDLHVCSDSLNGMGAVLALVTDDMDGQARNASTPDIGSDEFAPLTQAGFLGPDVVICTGDSVILSAGAPADAVLWSNMDTTTSTTISVVGTYNVSVIGACGVAFDTIVVEQSNLAYAGYLMADTIVFCSGDSVLLTSSMTADTYSWTGGSSDDSLTITAGGTYTLNITDACGSGTESIVITENSAPSANFSSVASYLSATFTNNSTSPSTGTSYLWDFGDGNTSTSVNPTHVYDTIGVYTVTLTVTNDCGSSTFTETFSTTVGLEEIAGLGTIAVYPNPSNGLFNVDFNLNNELNATIKVTNVLGETIYAKALGTINGLNTSAIDITTAAPGVYYVTVLSNEKAVYNNMLVKN
jgi:PKD repeat protein